MTLQERCALWAEILGTQTQNNCYLLPTQYRGVYYTSYFIGRPSLFYGSAARRVNGDAEKMTNSVYDLLLSQESHDKVHPGLCCNEIDKPNFNQISISWGTPRYYSVGFTRYDLQSGLRAELVEAKANQILRDDARKTERAIFTAAATNADIPAANIITQDLLSDDVTPSQAYSIIVNLANQVTRAKIDKYGIDEIAPESIVISVPVEVATKLAESRILGDATKVTWDGGAYSLYNIGGYRLIINNYLPAGVQAFISTDFVLPQESNLLAMNVERLSPTNDMGIYIEKADLCQLVMPELVYMIKAPTAQDQAVEAQATTSTKKKNNTTAE